MKQKKKRTRLTLIIFNLLTLFFIINPTLSAWDDCPFGLENDTYPGACGRYIDTNNDGICDKSQANPNISQQKETNQGDNTTQSKKSSFIFKNKNIIILTVTFVIVIAGIILSKMLTKKQVLSKIKEKIIWNLLLLFFFIPSAISGVTMILMVDYPILREININYFELHNYSSFFFMWISAYHIFRHSNYYIDGIKKLTKK